jgi:hypothetical protein
MKDIFITVGLAVLAVAVIYGVWRVTPGPVIPQPAATSGSSTTDPATPPQKSGAKPKISAKRGVPAPLAAAEIPPPEVAEPIPAPPPLPQVPQSTAPQPVIRPANPAQVSIGMPSRQVVELLGNPALKTATIVDGSLLETYIYTKGVQGDFARIQFLRDRVVSDTQ